MKNLLFFILSFLLISCNEIKVSNSLQTKAISNQGVSIVILGTIQDAGSPHIACKKDCCEALFKNPDVNRQVVALGIIDNMNSEKYLFEATPDISRQLKSLVREDIKLNNEIVDGIFLTHAHIGHYSGLMYLGKEATNAKDVTVYAMPRMKSYIETNGPWSQLVSNNNISLARLNNEVSVVLSQELSVTPFLVPHRDEYSETVGYKISGPNKTALFIPDIDKWSKWEKNITEEIKKVDYAFLDATFYSGAEINNRDISQIPHPFIIESLSRFKNLNAKQKNKIIFIHFNHTNPVLDITSNEAREIIRQGFNIGKIYNEYQL